MEHELTLEEVHIETIKHIEYLDQLCEKIGVNYSVCFGTLIGTVRHKGFIPWDDDFDIVMLRPDYDKFVNYCQTHLEELGPYRLMNKDTTEGYPYNLSRFCDTRYRMESFSQSDAGMGLFIDIYPLDGIGNDPEKARKRIRWKKRLYTIGWTSSIKQTPPPSKKGFILKGAKYLLYLWAKNKTPRYFFDKFDSLSKVYDYDSSDWVAVVTWDTGFYPMKKAWIKDCVRMPFETISVRAPKEYDKILKEIYGDYMTLPPVEKRHATHSYRLFRKDNQTEL